MATNVYVDGFNFYYGVYKRPGMPPYVATCKWLDHSKLAEIIWPELRPVGRVRYFTANVHPAPSDPNSSVRQQVYLRAIASLGVDIHRGQFKCRRKTWTLKGETPQMPPSTEKLVLNATAEIGKFDEKGSDVNLATYLVRDAAKADCDKAIVVSNDSDLVLAIEVTRADFSVPVYVINPQARTVREIGLVAAGVRRVKPKDLVPAQMPATMTDANGTFSKPSTW